MLRALVWILGAGLTLFGLKLRLDGDLQATGMIVPGLVILAAMAFERWRYQPRMKAGEAGWQRTDERFVDPETDRLVQVEFNPVTGERRYRDIGGGSDTSTPNG